jgi:murein DD-endopeptidase MepM/ murein hydrolase activator NlpD
LKTKIVSGIRVFHVFRANFDRSGQGGIKMGRLTSIGYSCYKHFTLILVLIVIFVTQNPVTTSASCSSRSSVSEWRLSDYGLAVEAAKGLAVEAAVGSKSLVQPGQTLSKILLSHGLPTAMIQAVVRKSKNVFDVRKMRAGASYFTIKGSGSDTHPAYLVYEQNLYYYVVFKLDAPVNVFRGRKRVETKTRTISGVIEKSLIGSLNGHKFAYEIAVSLSEIYAWSLDFYRLQKGDHFKALLEEEYVGGKPVGLGKILAARFNHRGRDFYAFYFKQGAVGRYYDERAYGLKKAFLNSPLKYSRITSRFSKGRFHPILKRLKRHIGVDYAAPIGTPVMSVGDGVVRESAYIKDLGRYVMIGHNGVYATQYLHLSRFAKEIRPGLRVKRGDIIGYVGSSGLATGPHLEFRLFKNSRPVDPLKEDLPAIEPLGKAHLEKFQQLTAKRKEILDGVGLAEVIAKDKCS